jgi:ubiquinone/menaquinone biosynthesis C-methylase UbiE
MILNRVEFLMMNNPLRRALQRHFEGPRFLRMGGTLPGARALELGCGQGVGAEIILDLFEAASVDAFDLDAQMVAIARRRLISRGSQVRLWVGDAMDINALDGTYDAVFDFGIIHHVSKWQRVLAEANRVLRPGGLLFAEEPVGWVTKSLLLARLFGYFQDAAQLSQYGFGASEFRHALEAAGFVLQKEQRLLGVFSWFVARKTMTAQQGAPPNVGPAARSENSDASGGGRHR